MVGFSPHICLDTTRSLTSSVAHVNLSPLLIAMVKILPCDFESYAVEIMWATPPCIIRNHIIMINQSTMVVKCAL